VLFCHLFVICFKPVTVAGQRIRGSGFRARRAELQERKRMWAMQTAAVAASTAASTALPFALRDNALSQQNRQQTPSVAGHLHN